MKKTVIPALLLMFILAGCAKTIPNVVRSRPLPQNEFGYSIGITASFSKLDYFTWFATMHYGIDETSVISATAPIFLVPFLPGNINYTKYFKADNGNYYNVNAGWYDILGNEYNPTFKVGAGVEFNKHLYVYSDIGLHTSMNLLNALRDSSITSFLDRVDNKFDFALGIEAGHGDYSFNVQYNSSIVDYYIDYYKNFYGLEKDFTLYQRDLWKTDSVNVLERNGRLINKDTLGAQLQYIKPRFKMKEGDHYIVAKNTPYRHWGGDGYERRLYDLYSNDSSNFIIKHEPYTDIRWHLNVENLGLTDLSFEEIKDSLQKNGSIRIKRPGSSIKEAQENVNWYNRIIMSVNHKRFK